MDAEESHAYSQSQRKRKRSRLGCNTCRARKVKCDERPGRCANCERLSLECIQVGHGTPGPQAKSVRGKKTLRSCNRCRTARTKCSGERPACQACQDAQATCSYVDEQDSIRVQIPGESSSDHRAETNDSRLGHSVMVVDTPSTTASSTSAEPPRWLKSPTLPEPKHVRVLVSHYFQSIHPLRCYAFIHKPSCLRQLDDTASLSRINSPLLHAICALGAQFFALEYSETVHELPYQTVRLAGDQWAKKATSLLFENMDEISVEALMAAQLLYDHALRMANFTQAFLLSGLIVRLAQALQINLEYSAGVLHNSSPDAPSVTTRESRRRLMWSCYVTDVLLGSGVDQLSLIHERDIKIQLPSADSDFLHARPAITGHLGGDDQGTGSIGMMAYFVQQTELRRRVLRYIKHLDKAMLPWLPNSEFAQLEGELQSWYASLPSELEFTPTAIYTREQSNQLGALCLFHCAYHQTLCDLYRLGAPSLYKLRRAFDFPPDQADFARSLQWRLFVAGRTLAAIIATGERHGPGTNSDSWLPTIAYDSSRIMLYYLTQLAGSSTDRATREVLATTVPYLHSNLQALKTMRALNVVADGLADAAEDMLKKVQGVDTISILPLPGMVLDDPYLLQLDPARRWSRPGTPPQTAPDYVLNPLSIYRMARTRVRERHAPETQAGVPQTTSSSDLFGGEGSTTAAVPSPQGIAGQQGHAGFLGDHDTHGGFGEGLHEDMFDFSSMPDLDWAWPSPGTMMMSDMLGDGIVPDFHSAPAPFSLRGIPVPLQPPKTDAVFNL